MELSKEHICPKCGTIMKPLPLDGSTELNGNLQLDGFYCPNCQNPDTDETSKDNNN